MSNTHFGLQSYLLPFLLLLLFIPFVSSAEESLVTCSGLDCQFCHLVSTGQNVMNWLVLVLTIIAGLLFAYAGLMLVTSTGNRTFKQKALTIFNNVIIGYLLVLAGWLLVDTTLKALANQAHFAEGGVIGPWNRIECVDQPYVASIDYGSDSPGNPGTPPQPCDPDDPDNLCGHEEPPIGGATFTYSTSLESDQQNHLSSALRQFKNCIADNAITRVYTITSVSDNLIARGESTWEQCAESGCAHSPNSCHYGGRNCIGESYAIDVRVHDLTTTEENSFMDAARSCNGYANVHGSGPSRHIHASIGFAAGCGCNQSLCTNMYYIKPRYKKESRIF